MRQSNNASYEQAIKAMAMSDIDTLMHYVLNVWIDDHREIAKQNVIQAAQEKMAQANNESYERALKAMAMSDTASLMHYVLNVWIDMHKDEVKQQEFEAAREKMRQSNNASYE